MRLTTRRRIAAPLFPAPSKILDFMRLIWVMDPALQEISRRTGATGLLERLERQALTTRRCDRWDGRKWLMVLTSKGPRFDVRTEGRVEIAVRRALARVSPRRLRSARDVPVALSQALRHQTARCGQWAASATECPSGCP